MILSRGVLFDFARRFTHAVIDDEVTSGVVPDDFGQRLRIIMSSAHGCSGGMEMRRGVWTPVIRAGIDFYGNGRFRADVEESYHPEYANYSHHPVIGSIFDCSVMTSFATMLAHEASHCVQMYGFTSGALKRKPKCHGTIFKRIYKRARLAHINPYVNRTDKEWLSAVCQYRDLQTAA